MTEPTRPTGAIAPNSSSSLSLSPSSHLNNNNNNPPRIIVDPSPQNQTIYNQVRLAQDRQNEQTAAYNNSLQPQAGSQSMSCSPSTDSYASRSISHSPINEPETHRIDSTLVHTATELRRPRGRRKGPLDPETRKNTALKRKLKTTCKFHREKKTKVTVHPTDHLFVWLLTTISVTVQISLN